MSRNAATRKQTIKSRHACSLFLFIAMLPFPQSLGHAARRDDTTKFRIPWFYYSLFPVRMSTPAQPLAAAFHFSPAHTRKLRKRKAAATGHFCASPAHSSKLLMQRFHIFPEPDSKGCKQNRIYCKQCNQYAQKNMARNGIDPALHINIRQDN